MFDGLIHKYTESTGSSQQREDTIFDICGYPHYESVASNVLSFFLDNKREHGFGTLFLDSLLACAGHSNLLFESDYVVDREVSTGKGNFIDILIYDADKAIYIENKVYASLYNDLDDYLKTAKEGRNTAFGVILSLFDIQNNENKASYITYDNLFGEVRKRFGEYINNKKLNYLSLMLDFIRNMAELKKGNKMNNEFVAFMKDNHDEVGMLAADIKRFHDDLRKIVENVNNIVLDIKGELLIEQRAWRRLPDFYDMSISKLSLHNGAVLELDSTLDVHGWSFAIYVKSNTSSSDVVIEEYCKFRKLEGSLDAKGRYVLATTIPLESNPEIVASEIVNILKTLNA